MTFLDRKALLEERRNSRMEELDNLAKGTTGAFSEEAEQEDSIMKLAMKFQQPGFRRNSVLSSVSEYK